MTRVAVVSPENLTEEGLAVWNKITEKRGAVRGPYAVLMHLPKLAEKVGDLGEYLRFDGKLQDKDRELAILVVARIRNTEFEWVIHEPIARKAGISDKTCEAVRTNNFRSIIGRERLLTDIVNELCSTDTLSDSMYTRALTEFSEADIVEMVSLIGFYTMISFVLRAFHVELPAGAAHPFE